MKTAFMKLTFWKAVAILIVCVGLYSVYIRITQGLAGATNLSDGFTWGLWTGFKLWAVSLSAGGFILCAVTHIFNIEQFKPFARSAILTAFLGYLSFIIALIFDLGRPLMIWHVMIMWNLHSVMFEVAWCVMLYTTVLFIEFSPAVMERFKLGKLLSINRRISVPIMIFGILLSTMHQSSLGSLFLIIPEKMHPLWYSPVLPIYFYVSAIGAGFSMVIFESYFSARAFNRGLQLNLLSKIGLFSAWFIVITVIVRFSSIILQGNASYLFEKSQEGALFWLEMLVGAVLPLTIYFQKKLRQSRKWLYIASVLVICGAGLNRINVSITSLYRFTHINYFPSFHEVSIMMLIIVSAMFAFRTAVKYLPVYDHVEHDADNSEYELEAAKGSAVL